MKKIKLSRLLMILGSVFIFTSCFFDGSGPFKRIEGQGPVVSEEFDLPRIRGIVVRNSADIFITQSDNQKVVVEAQRNIIDNLKQDVSNGIWYIENREPVWKTKPVQIRIRMSDLNMIKISGSGDITGTNKFKNLDDLDLRVSGSGDIHLSVEAKDVIGHIGGSGSITLEGEAREVDFVISGSGSIKASDLEARKAYAKISGSGSIHVNAKDDLDAVISGSGSINYKGDPRVDKRISGSGNVRER